MPRPNTELMDGDGRAGLEVGHTAGPSPTSVPSGDAGPPERQTQEERKHKLVIEQTLTSIRRTARTEQELVGLATLVSTAVRVSPALLREVRLKLLPFASVETELKLWNSPWVQASDRSGFTFFSRASQALRRYAIELALAAREGQQSLAQINASKLSAGWDIVERHHKGLPGIQLVQANLHWSVIRAALGETSVVQVQERLLESVVEAVRQQDPQALRWLFHSLPLLEPSIHERRAALLAAWAVASRVKGFRDRHLLIPHETDNCLLKELAAVLPDKLPRTTLGLSYERGMICLNPWREGTDALQLIVPQTTPLLVRLRWQEGMEWREKWLLQPERGDWQEPLPENCLCFQLHNAWGEGIEVGVAGKAGQWAVVEKPGPIQGARKKKGSSERLRELLRTVSQAVSPGHSQPQAPNAPTTPLQHVPSDAWNELLHTITPMVRSQVKRYFGRSDAQSQDDVVQTVLMLMLQNNSWIHVCLEAQHPRDVLLVIVRHGVIRAMRDSFVRRRATSIEPSNPDDKFGELPDVHDALAAKQELEAIRGFLSTQSEADRRLFELHFIQEQDASTVAAEFGIATNVFYQRLKRLRALLRRYLEEMRQRENSTNRTRHVALEIGENTPILSLIHPDDRVLALNYQANMLKLEPPPGAAGWESLPCGVDNLVLVNQSGRGEALRETNLRVDVWEKSIAEVRAQVERALKGLQGRLHVFFGGPHALALWLGRCLEVQGRQVPTFIHQWDGRDKAWKLFALPPELAPDVQQETFYASMSLEVEGSGKSGVVLNINATSKASPAQLKALCERAGAREVQTLNPSNNGWMTSLVQNHAAIEQLRRATDELHRLYPTETIHVCTSAPIALLVAFGQQLRHTVTTGLLFYHYDTSTGRYYPVMDVMSGKVPQARRPRLEIVSEDGAIQYILNGEVLRGWRADLEGEDGTDRRIEDESELRERMSKLWSQLLPEGVENAIQDLHELDIEVKAKGKVADLPWELLFLPHTQQQFAVLLNGWTLTRFVRGKARPYVARQVRDLRVLIIPALEDADYEAPYLRLGALQAQFLTAGATVKLLNYGVELETIGRTIEEFQPQIIHWVGLGGSGRGRDSVPQLLVKSSGDTISLDYTRVRSLFQPAKELRLVTFIAGIVGHPGEGNGLPTHLLLEGAGAVIGFRDPIGMLEARNFSVEFYAQVLAGASVRDAVARARRIMHARYPTLPASFAAPMLTVSDSAGGDPIVRHGSSFVAQDAPPQKLWDEALPIKGRVEALLSLGRVGDPRLGLEKPENWIYLPPGELRMGSNEFDREKPIHQVKLTHGFYLSRFQVTNHDFRPFVEGDGYRNRQWWSSEGWEFKEQERLTEPLYWQDAQWNAPNQPVVSISWFEAQAFCAWLNAQQQKRPFGEGLGKVRLPTEVEWEYAARGKEGRKYPWGNEEPTPERANYNQTGVGTTSPVGAFPQGATPEGLLDLAGNVWEWCEDCYHRNYEGAPLDGSARTSGCSHPSSRVVRGGRWGSDGVRLRAADRSGGGVGDRSYSVGFRVVWPASRGAAP